MLAFVILGVIILVGFVFLMYKIVDYKRLYLQFKTLYEDLSFVVKNDLEIKISKLEKDKYKLLSDYSDLLNSNVTLQSQFDELYNNFTELDNLFNKYKKENPIKTVNELVESVKEQMNNLCVTETKKKRRYKNNPNLKLQG